MNLHPRANTVCVSMKNKFICRADRFYSMLQNKEFES